MQVAFLLDCARRLSFVLLAVLAGSCATVPAPTADLAIRNVGLVDPGARAVRAVTILIDDGRVRTVTAPNAAPRAPARQEIDGSGLYAVSGLWDAHTHLAEGAPDEAALDALVRHGVLGVRDAGSALEPLLAWRRRIAAGARSGPRIVAAGPTLNGPGDDSLHIEVADTAGARAAVAALADRGVRWIKVHRLLAPALLPAVIDEAHRRGLRVFGHIPLGMSPLAACEAGMDGIEHVGSVLESIVSVRQGGAADLAAAVAELESPATRAFVACLADRGASFTPTLSVYLHLAGSDPQQRRMAERLVGALGPFVLRLHRAGVRLLAGSDAPLDGAVPWGIALHEELRLLDEAGLSPQDVLRLATTDSAAYLAGEQSALAPGNRADLVLLRANPLEAVGNLRAVERVVVGGRLATTPEPRSG